MSSPSTTHFLVGARPRSGAASSHSEQPVVLLAFAKLVLMIGALAIFTPPWLDLLGDLAQGSSSEAWRAFSVLGLAGGTVWLGLGVLILKVWTGLLKHLARAD